MEFKKEVLVGSVITLFVFLVCGYYVINFLRESAEPLEVQPMEPLSLTMEMVSKHSTRNDCWIVVDGRVADVTDYLDLHPAGPESIIKSCGKDATALFDGIKRGEGHSVEADKQVDLYVIGTLSNN